MTSNEKKRWLSKFKKNMAALCREIDNTGNWLYDNPPPGMSENDLELFLSTMSDFGKSVLTFGLLVKIYLEVDQ